LKVVIAGGAGGVGASVAFNLLLGPGDHDVVLLDRRPEMVTSHVMDLEQVLEQGSLGSIRGGADEDVPTADILVVAASAPLTVNESRMVYLDANARIVARIADLLSAQWAGVLLVVTNPVDQLCTWLQRRTGIERRRVLGYTAPDQIWPASVMLCGEYGIGGVSLSVPVSFRPGAAERIHQWALTPEQRQGVAQAADFVRRAAEGIDDLPPAQPR
jgi:malate/lactate dehydrogenase